MANSRQRATGHNGWTETVMVDGTNDQKAGMDPTVTTVHTGRCDGRAPIVRASPPSRRLAPPRHWPRRRAGEKDGGGLHGRAKSCPPLANPMAVQYTPGFSIVHGACLHSMPRPTLAGRGVQGRCHPNTRPIGQLLPETDLFSRPGSALAVTRGCRSKRDGQGKWSGSGLGALQYRWARPLKATSRSRVHHMMIGDIHFLKTPLKHRPGGIESHSGKHRIACLLFSVIGVGKYRFHLRTSLASAWPGRHFENMGHAGFRGINSIDTTYSGCSVVGAPINTRIERAYAPLAACLLLWA